MNIISLIKDLLNNFNSILSLESLIYLEPTMVAYGDDMILKVYGEYLSAIDYEYKKSSERFEKYIVKETKKVSKLTYLGWVTYNETRYINRETNKSFVYLRTVLGMIPYQRMNEYAEYKLINYVKGNNMAQAARNALRGNIVSRSLVSKKMAKLNGTQHEEIKRKETPEILYIEMDEIHANLQDKKTNEKVKNHVCPCAIVHEGHVSNQYARYITSSPFAFSPTGLENKLKLLVMQPNKVELTYDGYLEMKYGNNEYKEIVDNMKKITNQNIKLKLIKDEIRDYNNTYKLNDIIDPLASNIINNLLSFNNAKTI